MTEPSQTPPPARRGALAAGLFGLAAVNVADSIPEGGMNSWTSIPAWAALAAVASLATLAPWLPGLSPQGRGGAWRAAVAGAVALGAMWVLFVLPGIHRSVAFLYTVGAAASAWSVANAPGRPTKSP